jgi:uncharacterized protein
LPEKVFIDTWAWLALGYRREDRHSEVIQIYQTLRSRRATIYTSDYVLDELITLLFRRERFEEATRYVEGIFAAAALGHIQVERVTAERFANTWNLRKRFQDKGAISFTDLSSMLIMQERGIQQILTEDKHFLHVGMNFKLLP